MIKITLPLPKIKEKGRFAFLSLNKYRNAHYISLNRAKKSYQEICYAKLLKHRQKRFKAVKLTIKLYSKTKQRRDLSNFCSVIDKFFCDTLVKMNIIEDDDCTIIKNVEYIFMGIEKDEVVIYVESLPCTPCNK